MSKPYDTTRVPGFRSASSFGRSRRLSRGKQVERHHGGVGDVGVEQVLPDEPDPVRHARRAGVALAFGDPRGIDVDADAARAVAPRRGDHDPPVAGAEVVDDVVLPHAGELQHRRDRSVGRRHERDVERRCGLLGVRRKADEEARQSGAAPHPHRATTPVQAHQAAARVAAGRSPQLSKAARVAARSASVRPSNGRRTGPPVCPRSSCQYFWCAAALPAGRVDRSA